MSDVEETKTNETSVLSDSTKTGSQIETSDISKHESSVNKTDVTELISDPSKDPVVVEKDKTDNENQTEDQSRSAELEDGQIFTADQLEEGSDDDDDDDSDDDDDDGRWITPSNIKNVKAKMGTGDTEKASVPVGCLTTDFAMQVSDLFKYELCREKTCLLGKPVFWVFDQIGHKHVCTAAEDG